MNYPTNETLKLKDNQNRPVVASFNQINGFFVVVEQAINKKNELILKTMYRSSGDYKNNNAYKKLQDTKPSKGQP